MTSDKFANIDLDEYEAKSMAVYREKIRPLVYPAQKGRMRSSTRKAATTRLTKGQRLPQSAFGSGGLEQFRSSTKSATNPPAGLLETGFRMKNASQHIPQPVQGRIIPLYHQGGRKTWTLTNSPNRK